MTEPEPTTVAYRGDELIIGLSNLGLVLSALATMKIEHSVPDTDEVLDLARITFVRGSAAVAVAVLDACQDLEGHEDSWRAGCPDSDHPLDQVLWGLRHWFGHASGGWTPTLGKNRLLGRVAGVGEIIHGSAGAPELVDGWSSPTDRAAGPGHGVRVGVLDTGFYPHPFLAGSWRSRFSDRIGPSSADYADGHATFVTGLILSQAPAATVEVRGVLRSDGGSADSWTVATEAVRFARSGIDVLNLSLVCYTEDGQPPLLIARAAERLAADLVIVAAAGNHGNPREQADGVRRSALPAYPAALDGVYAVGACDANRLRASFSPDQPWVDVLAPGVALRSTYLDTVTAADSSARNYGGWAVWNGTSFAAALVTGAIAAGIDPGRVDARAALADLRGTLPVVPTRQGGIETPVVRLEAW